MACLSNIVQPYESHTRMAGGCACDNDCKSIADFRAGSNLYSIVAALSLRPIQKLGYIFYLIWNILTYFIGLLCTCHVGRNGEDVLLRAACSVVFLCEVGVTCSI